MFNKSTFWHICGVVSCFFTVVCLSQSQFFEHQFKNTKSWLAYFFVAVLMFVACVFLFIPNKIRKLIEKIRNTNNHCPGWLVNAFVEFCILLFVVLVAVLSKYPRFKVFHKQDGSISDFRDYCQKSKYPDPDIKAICEGLVEEQNTEQGDPTGFFSAVSFSAFTFSIARLLKLPNEYGIFYMSLDLTMNAAMDIPVNGGSILHWKFVLISIAYAFCLIFLRGILHSSSDENERNHQPRETAAQVDGFIVNIEHLQGNSHHDVQSGGAGGGREHSSTGDDHNKVSEHEAEMAEEEIRTVSRSFDENDGNHQSRETVSRPVVDECVVNVGPHLQGDDHDDVQSEGGPEQNGIRDDHDEVSDEDDEGEGALGETEDVLTNLPNSNQLHLSDKGLRKRSLAPAWIKRRLKKLEDDQGVSRLKREFKRLRRKKTG